MSAKLCSPLVRMQHAGAWNAGCGSSRTATTWSCTAPDVKNEQEYLARALDLAVEYDVPVVATNQVRFLRRDDFEAHEARVCIQEGPDPGRSPPSPALLRPAVPAFVTRDGRALFGSSRGAREQRRDRPALQPGTLARAGSPSGLSGAAGHHAAGMPAETGRRRSGGAPGGTARRTGRACTVSRSPGDGARRHHPHGLCRLLSHRRRFHPLGSGKRSTGRTRTRLGGGFSGGLRVGHHRPRSD